MESLFNEVASNKYGIKESNGVNYISSVKVAGMFAMRHSNVMRAIETAVGHIGKPELNSIRSAYYANGRTQKMYYITLDVFAIITKRAANKEMREAVIDEMTDASPRRTESIPVIEKTDTVEILGKVADAVSDEKILSLLTGDIAAMLKSINEKLDLLIKAQSACEESRRITVPQTQPIKVSNEPISVGELAKVLNQTGINIGEMRLFQWLREKEYLCAYGSEYNLPRQKFIEQGLFVIKTSRVQLPTGQVVEKNTTKVTAKGQEYFINKFVYQSSQSR